MATQKLLWEDKYSVGVEEIDLQHKKIFAIINELLEAINTNSVGTNISSTIDSLVQYKIVHFETEEKYFKDFNYEETEIHKAKHQEFNNKFVALKEKYPEYTIEFVFELVDFLEDWLIDHLMHVDQKYVKCFKEHGLK